MRRTKKDSKMTREAILDAAVNIFSQKGVSYTSLSQIADEANVTRGAIYWHFKNKGEIFDALHDRLHQPFTEMVLQGMGDDNSNPIKDLQDVCIELLSELQDDISAQKAMILFLVKSDYSGDLAEYEEKHLAKKDESREMFHRYFQVAQGKGLLPADTNTEILTLSICCFMMGILNEYLRDPDCISLTDQAPKMIKQFFRGLV